MKNIHRTRVLSFGLAAILGMVLISPVIAANEGIVLVEPTDTLISTSFEYLRITITDQWQFTMSIESEKGELFGYQIFESESFADFTNLYYTETPFTESNEPATNHTIELFAAEGDRVVDILFINENEETIQINYEYSFETEQSIPGFPAFALFLMTISGICGILRKMAKKDLKPGQTEIRHV